LTPGQLSYVSQFCAKLTEALNSESDGEYLVDMDAVADAVGSAAEKPAFYYAEEGQQNKFTCEACGTVTDILGRFGYCAVCGTRNDLQELTGKTIPALRNRINAGGPYENCVKDAVSEFDSLVGVCVAQLLKHVAMTPARRNRLENRRFHNLQSVAVDLKEILDVDILEGIKPDDLQFAKMMFHRRHVYEHRGGEADDKYIADSGDSSIRPKQLLKETMESAHRIAGLVEKMATNLHRGFHEIFPPEADPIKRHRGA
jgi:hypothetical protein